MERVIPYDDLVIGLGCEDKYHGVPGAEEFTYSIQTIAKSRKTFEMLCGLTTRFERCNCWSRIYRY